MNLKKLMFLAAITSTEPQEENLLDYDDLENLNYGGDESAYNVRTRGMIEVEPGRSMRLTGLMVSEVNIRFYDESKAYQASETISKYADDTVSFDFVIPEGCYYIRPKWHRTTPLPVSEVIASNPVIKYI